MTATASSAQEFKYEGVPTHGTDWTRVWIDINGDGRDDYCMLIGDWQKDLRCHINAASSIGAVVDFPNLWQGHGGAEGGGAIKWLDLNGDGAVDVCRWVILPSETIVCRLGPDFVRIIYVPLNLSNYNPEFMTECCIIPESFGPGVVTGLSGPEYFFSDVSGDGVPDLCYIYEKSRNAFDLRCRLGTVASGRATIEFGAETTAWTRPNIELSEVGWPQGFYDFNADGKADFCQLLPGSRLSCILSTTNGFSSTAVITQSYSGTGATLIGVQAGLTGATNFREGAAFIDINGDGQIDFCRLTGSAYNQRLMCVLSNGIGWEYNAAAPGGDTGERVSPVIADAGNIYNRWWVDINGDGFPDYCRLASSPDPMVITSTGPSSNDVIGTLLCRLSRGDGDVANPRIAFGASDLVVSNLNLGIATGGRAFCDAQGTGVSVFCRATFRTTQLGSQSCWTNWETMVETCSPDSTNVAGYLAGYPNISAAARPPLLTAFSDGVGAETTIQYQPLTSPEVYSRSSTAPATDDRFSIQQPRSSVVYETRMQTMGATNTALTGTARYMYKDLRSDRWTGSLGFRERWIFNEGSNSLDHLVYFQGLGPTVDTGSVKYDARETGMPKCQEKFAVLQGLVPQISSLPSTWSKRQRYLREVRRALSLAPSGGPCALPDQAPSPSSPFVLLQVTSTTPGTTVPDNPRFKFPATTVTRNWDWNGTNRMSLSTATSVTTMDDLGNVKTVDQTTLDAANLSWRKYTVNTYSDNLNLWLLGRLVNAKVDSYAPSVEQQLAANATSSGTAANASLMAPAAPVPAVISPAFAATLNVIIQTLLLD